MSAPYYTTVGSVRGRCGHQHRTLEAAVACRRADQQGCRSQGGYSDRVVRIVEDGVERPLTADEAQYEDHVYSGGV